MVPKKSNGMCVQHSGRTEAARGLRFGGFGRSAMAERDVDVERDR